MRRALLFVAWMAAGTWPATLQPAAQARPAAAPRRDYRPYVKLMCDCSRRVYRLDRRPDGRLVEGPLIEATRGNSTRGSGTVLTADGLVLTNYHVYEALVVPDTIVNEADGLIVRSTPIRIIVAEVNPANPLGRPDEKYVAEAYGLYPDRDMAVVKIVRDARTNQPLDRRDFTTATLGNPYAIDDEGELVLIGYPGKGGETVTLSRGLFQGYMFGGSTAPDGAIKSNATAAGGNSGGAALFGNRLVGVPTRVSPKAEKGADFSYMFPVTWAARPLAYAALRFDQAVPALDAAWLRDTNNTDIAHDRVFVGARVRAAQSGQSLANLTVVAHRRDRTFEQVVALSREISTYVKSQEIFQALRMGRDTTAVALVRGLARAEVVRLARQFRVVHVQLGVRQGRDTAEVADELALSRADAVAFAREPSVLSPDAEAAIRGTFQYFAADTESDGFVFLTLPRGQVLTVTIQHPSYREYSATITTTSGVSQKLADIRLFSR